MDINYNGDDPRSWLWVGDYFLNTPGLGLRFYAPSIADPVATKTIFVGGNRVFRTTNAGGDRTHLEQHCNTAANEFGTSDELYTGSCGTAADWPTLGPSSVTGSVFGTTKTGGSLTTLARGIDAGTLWGATSAGRVLISKNANAAPASVTFTRIDTPAQPGRVPSAITVDPTNPNHAFITFSGYDVNTAATPGHVFEVTYDPSAGTATWKNVSYDYGDQPANAVAFDAATGDLYVATDFTVVRLVSGTTAWIPAADGLSTAAVSDLVLTNGKNGDRLLYAATHGRGAYRLRLK
jgi:hypothetical protein